MSIPAPNAAWAITAVSCTDSNSAITGNTGTFGTFSGQVLTVAAANIVAGANINCIITETKAYVFVRKISNGGTGSFSFASQTNLASIPISITTTIAGTAAPTVQSLNDYTNFINMNTTSSITETANSAYAVTGFSCTDANASVTGNSGTFGSLAGLVGTIPSGNVKAGAAITCVFTNSKTPTFKLQVTTSGGAGGAFSFAQTNLASAPASITTTAASTATPVSPTAINVTTTGTQITVTGTPPAGFDLNAVSCTDANSSITGNTGSFGTIVANQLTVPYTRVVAGADFTCVLTSIKLPTLTLTMISTGNAGPFTFTGTNGWASQTITTTAVNAGVAGATQIFSAASLATTISHSIPAGWTLYAYSCTGSLAGNFSLNYSTGDLSINAAAMAPGNALACTFTDQKTPTFKVQVSTIGGVGGPFTFSQSNLATTPSNITTIAAGTATPSSPTAHLVWAVGSDVSVTQTPPSGFSTASANCTDANSSITGNSGNFGTVVGNQITVLGSQVVAGADVTCLFTVNKLPTLTFTENSAGGVATFTITGTNGWPSQNITTVTPGVSVVGATQTLSAASTATTITHSIPSGFAIAGYGCYNMNGGSGILTYATGILQLDAAATAPGNAIQCTIITNKLPTLTLTVLSNGGARGFTFTGTNGWSSQTITTVTSGVGVVGATQTLSYASTSTTITQAIPTGYTLTSISCSGLGSGNATPNLGSGTITLDASATAAGNTIACTFTNTKIPTFKLQVISQAGSGGPMHFSQTNLASAPPDVSWGAMNVLSPPSPTPINVDATGTAITVSQTVEYRYATTGVSCSDANSAVTGNTGSFGSLSGPLGFETITIEASQVVAGADFTCILTVKRIARLAFSVVTLGGIGTTGVVLPTNQPNQSLVTSSPNTPVAGTPSYFNAMNVDSTIAVTPPAGYTLSSVTCSDTDPAGPWGSGTLTVNSAAGTFTLEASQVVFGANYSCTITTSKVPVVRLQLQTIGGFGGPFTFTQTNLVSTPPSIITTVSSTATPASPSPISVSTIGISVAVTGTPPVGFDINEANCVDASSAITGNTGSFGSIATNVLTLAATNIVAGADITCLLTSHKLPTITLTVISNGMTGSFDFAGSNGFGTQTITTATPGVGATGATITLAAASNETTITETLNFSYIMVSTSCTGLSTGSPTVDTTAGTVSFASAALEPGASINCTITNEAAQPLLSLSNAASPATVSAAGSAISYTLNIANVGNVPLTSIAVSDGVGTVTCGSSGNATIASLSPSANETCTVNYTTTQADFDGSGGGDGDIDNSATAQTTYGGGQVTASGSSTVLLVIAPQLSIIKSANTAGPVSVNDVIAYTYTVTNTGNITINNVTINDVHSAFGVPPVPGSEMLQTDSVPSGDSADVSANGSWDSLAPGDTIAFSSTYTVVQADIDNQ